MGSSFSESHVGRDKQEDSNNMDKAWSFLKDNLDVDEAAVAAVNMNALRRQIDWRIVPLMFLCYTMQFLDKVILNYAAVMGLTKDLALKGNEFSNVATFLFVGLVCFEIPNAFFLQHFPAAKWLGFNVMCWGIATACVAAATNYPTLLVARIFLGIFEATIAPSLALISSQWYTKSEQAPRFSFWYLGLGIGQIVGGTISYGFQHVHHTSSLSGWRAMFITLGVFTIVVGACVILFLPDTPMQARWLSKVQKVALLKHVSVNQTGIQGSTFRLKEIVEGLLDPQVYLLFVSNILLSIPSGVVTTYSATLIRNLHYTPQKAALMNMPSGAVSIFFTLLVGYGIRQQSYRFVWIALCIIPGIIGGALMSFMPITNRAGILAGIYLVNAIVAPMPVYFGWTVANVAGSTKRAFACAAMSAAFSLGNIIGPQTFQAKDAPQYRPAKITVLASCSAGLLTTFCLFMYYVWQNQKRGVKKVQQEEEYKKAEVWETLTDKENVDFRYTY